MQLLPLRTNLSVSAANTPFTIYTVGTEIQSSISRLSGFSAAQLFVTFSGSGKFRTLDHPSWRTLSEHSVLYIPAGVPHEYRPDSTVDWFVGYVTYRERTSGFLQSWGFGPEPVDLYFAHTQALYPQIEAIWQRSGGDYCPWYGAEALFTLLLRLKREAQVVAGPALHGGPSAIIGKQVVDRSIRFLHDHLQRRFTMEQLAHYAGYSTKHLTRLFRESVGMTPLQYLHRYKLEAARVLLVENPDMTVRQAAAYVGMESGYFTRLFKRQFGQPPDAYRNA